VRTKKNLSDWGRTDCPRKGHGPGPTVTEIDGGYERPVISGATRPTPGLCMGERNGGQRLRAAPTCRSNAGIRRPELRPTRFLGDPRPLFLSSPMEATATLSFSVVVTLTLSLSLTSILTLAFVVEPADQQRMSNVRSSATGPF
jgi:hypothetical protein